MFIFTLRGCRWHTIKLHVLHTRSPWPRTFQQHQKDINKSISTFIFTLRGCRWHTIKSHVLHTRSPWPRTFQQHQKDVSKSTSMLVFTLRKCPYHTVRSLAFPVVNIYNCLVGSARLLRVYVRPSRGSRVDRYTRRSIVEHRRLSPDNSSQKYIRHIVICSLHTYMWNIRSAQRAMKSARNIYIQSSKVAHHNLQNPKATR